MVHVRHSRHKKIGRERVCSTRSATASMWARLQKGGQLAAPTKTAICFASESASTEDALCRLQEIKAGGRCLVQGMLCTSDLKREREEDVHSSEIARFNLPPSLPEVGCLTPPKQRRFLVLCLIRPPPFICLLFFWAACGIRFRRGRVQAIFRGDRQSSQAAFP